MTQTKPPIKPVVKWIIIAIVCMFAMGLVFAGFVIVRLTPLLQFDDFQDKISLLGGMVEVDGQRGRVSLHGPFSDHDKNVLEGSIKISEDQKVHVNFGNGKLELSNSNNNELSWDCTVQDSNSNGFQHSTNKDIITLDFTSLSAANCDLLIPEGVQVSVHGTNGKLQVNEPFYHLDAELTNGKVALSPDADHFYRYSFSTVNGKIDTFESSDEPSALVISIRMTNGKISRIE